jgi:hypothetical protein
MTAGRHDAPGGAPDSAKFARERGPVTTSGQRVIRVPVKYYEPPDAITARRCHCRPPRPPNKLTTPDRSPRWQSRELGSEPQTEPALCEHATTC